MLGAPTLAALLVRVLPTWEEQGRFVRGLGQRLPEAAGIVAQWNVAREAGWLADELVKHGLESEAVAYLRASHPHSAEARAVAAGIPPREIGHRGEHAMRRLLGRCGSAPPLRRWDRDGIVDPVEEGAIPEPGARECRTEHPLHSGKKEQVLLPSLGGDGGCFSPVCPRSRCGAGEGTVARRLHAHGRGRRIRRLP